jgi:hypothetical protein
LKNDRDREKDQEKKIIQMRGGKHVFSFLFLNLTSDLWLAGFGAWFVRTGN